MRTSPCKGCGKQIVWGRTRDNKNVPLDPKPPVYRVVAVDDDRQMVERVEGAMVSHFSTCPNANDFSASRRDQQKGASSC